MNRPGRPPSTERVRKDLETVLENLRQHQIDHPDDPMCAQWAGMKLQNKAVTVPASYLLDARGSLGIVSRLILIRCKLRLSGKTIESDYLQTCKNQGISSERSSAIRRVFSLTDTRFSNPPDIENLTSVMSAILNTWRTSTTPERAPLPPHPESAKLFLKRFQGKNACSRFVSYLEYDQAASIQLSSKRYFASSGERTATVNELVSTCVNGDAMLMNLHAKGHWDDLRAVAETLARKIDQRELDRSTGIHRNAIARREVLFVPLRANAPPRPQSNRTISSSLPDEHMGLDRLIGILSSFTSHGAQADLSNAPPMGDEVGFINSLHEIRKSLLTSARIFIFDGVHDPSGALSRKTLQRVLADEHFLFVLKRLMDPLITSTDEPQSLDIFYQNRFIVTSNNEDLHNSIWTASIDTKGNYTRAAPVSIRLPEPHVDSYDRLLKKSVRHADEVSGLLKIKSLRHVRNDVVNQCLSASISMLSAILPRTDNKTNALTTSQRSVKQLRQHLVREDDVAGDDTRFVIKALMHALHTRATKRSKRKIDKYSEDTPRLWAELLLLLSLSPEGLTLETIQRCLIRLAMMPSDIAMPCPAIYRAFESGTLESRLLDFTTHANALTGFIRREFVEGPEVEDHPLEFWEGMSQGNSKNTKYNGLTLDFRYPEIRNALQSTSLWTLWQMDKYAVHRVISEIALQYQTTYLRHTDYRHRGSVRNWRRLLTSLYHGLASIGHPDLAEHKDYGVRDVDAAGNSTHYWLFLYAKLYRQIMEGPGLWRISRVMGLDDLKISILELFSKPWLLDSEFSSEPPDRVRFIEHFNSSAQPAVEYYLTRIRADLARGETAKTKTAWIERFNNIEQTHVRAIDKLRVEYAQLERGLQTAHFISTDHVIEVVERITQTDGLFQSLQQLVHNPDDGSGLLSRIPQAGHIDQAGMSSLLSLVEQDKVRNLVARMVDKTANNTSLVAMALIYFGTLSRFESDRVDFSEGYRQLKNFPEGLPNAIVKSLKQSLLKNDAQCMRYRQLALARLVIVEAARIELFRFDPVGTGFVRSNAQARTAARLAIKLDNEYRRQMSIRQAGPSAYFRFARRLADSSTRMAWQFPRDQANALVIEASMLRAESERLIVPGTTSVLEESNALLAERLLLAARSTLGRAERVMTTPNLVSRARLRMTLERFKLNQELARYYAICHQADIARTFQQHADFDLGVLRGAAQDNDTRPYWKLLVWFQQGL